MVIDLICYRRRGHNEADNPSFTQPLMYDLIDAKRSTRKLYTESLIGRGDITMEEAEQALRDYQQHLERAFTETREAAKRPMPTREPWSGRPPPRSFRSSTRTRPPRSPRKPSSGSWTPSSTCRTGSRRIPGCSRMLARRATMVEQNAIDWATGELLAFGSVLMDGHPVRLVGQDTRRGTFGQRHAVLVDRHTGAEYTPLRVFNSPTARFHVYDSLLSEYAAVGFEYGYSVARPEALVCWEAQFGDFVNGAQTILDEFISSGEQKWGQPSSVVLLLPHGYEGQGPDHSSARIERFLGLCAQGNMTVTLPTTPANYFHLLRWQALSGRRTPLVVFTPKSMLRLKDATSAVADFASGSFRPVIGDQGHGDPAAVRQVLLCSGKVYYDLARAAGGGGTRGHRDHPGGAALPAPGRGTRGGDRQVPGGRVGHLGAGGAGQHGRLADDGAQAAGGPRPPGRPRLAAAQLGAGHGVGHRARRGAPEAGQRGFPGRVTVYFTDRGIEELDSRRGADEVTLAWLAERLREFVDLFPESETAVDRLATWLARLDDEDG